MMYRSIKTSINLSNMFHTKSQNVHFAHFDIAGFSYWEGCMVMHKLEIGTKVELVREADNRFDPYAVAVHFDGYKLGYIPRTANEQFCALMDQGYSDMFEARIQRITPDSHMEHQVGVIVYLKKA